MLQSYSKNVYTDSRYIYLQWSSLYHNCVRLCGILLVITYLLGMAQTVYRWRNYVNNSRSIFTSTDIIINLSLKYIWIKLNWAEHILCINCIVFTTDLYYYIIYSGPLIIYFSDSFVYRIGLPPVCLLISWAHKVRLVWFFLKHRKFINLSPYTIHEVSYVIF